MGITLINPPEKLRVWAGVSESMSYGVYCFPPLGLMYIQAALEKHTDYIQQQCISNNLHHNLHCY